jgi:hypothetical protein
MMTLMLITLLAWFSLSLPLAVLVGKCIKLGTADPNARLAPKQGKKRRPAKLFRDPASA